MQGRLALNGKAGIASGFWIRIGQASGNGRLLYELHLEGAGLSEFMCR